MMKAGLLALTALFVAACSTSSTEEQASLRVIDLGKDLWTQIKSPKSTGMPQFTRAQMDAATTRLMLFEIESDKRGAAAGLINTNAGVQSFATGDGVGLMMRDGVVISSRGFGLDMMSSSGPSLAQIRASKGSWERRYQHLGPDDQIVESRFECHITPVGAENVTIAQEIYATQKYSELCHGESGEVRNEYWVDSSGILRQSRQWLNTSLGMLTIADPM